MCGQTISRTVVAEPSPRTNSSNNETNNNNNNANNTSNNTNSNHTYYTLARRIVTKLAAPPNLLATAPSLLYGNAEILRLTSRARLRMSIWACMLHGTGVHASQTPKTLSSDSTSKGLALYSVDYNFEKHGRRVCASFDPRDMSFFV